MRVLTTWSKLLQVFGLLTLALSRGRLGFHGTLVSLPEGDLLVRMSTHCGRSVSSWGRWLYCSRICITPFRWRIDERNALRLIRQLPERRQKEGSWVAVWWYVSEDKDIRIFRSAGGLQLLRA